MIRMLRLTVGLIAFICLAIMIGNISPFIKRWIPDSEAGSPEPPLENFEPPLSKESSSQHKPVRTVQKFFSCVNAQDYKCSYSLISPEFGTSEEHQQYWQQWKGLQLESISQHAEKKEVYAVLSGEFRQRKLRKKMTFWLEPLDEMNQQWQIVRAKDEPM